MEKLAYQSSDVRSAADTLRQDFEELVRIFERHLDSTTGVENEARALVEEAKRAAERGLTLTGDLVVLVGNVGGSTS